MLKSTAPNIDCATTFKVRVCVYVCVFKVETLRLGRTETRSWKRSNITDRKNKSCHPELLTAALTATRESRMWRP